MKTGAELPNTGCVWEEEAVAEAEVNEKPKPDEAPVEDPNTIGALLADAPKENKVDGDAVLEPKIEGFGACQGTPLELIELVSDDEAEVLAPKLEPITLGIEERNRELLDVDKPNIEGLEVEEPHRELPKVKDVVSEVPNVGDGADEPN